MGFQGSIGSPRCSADAQRASPLAFPSQVGGKSHRALHPNRFAPDPSPRLRHSKQRTIDRGSPGRGPSLCRACTRSPCRPPSRKENYANIASDRGHARDLCCRVRRSRRPLLLFLLPRRWIFISCARCLHGALRGFACVHDVFFHLGLLCCSIVDRVGSFMDVEGNDVRSEDAVRRKQRRWLLRTRLHSP